MRKHLDCLFERIILFKLLNSLAEVYSKLSVNAAKWEHWGKRKVQINLVKQAISVPQNVLLITNCWINERRLFSCKFSIKKLRIQEIFCGKLWHQNIYEENKKKFCLVSIGRLSLRDGTISKCLINLISVYERGPLFSCQIWEREF